MTPTNTIEPQAAPTPVLSPGLDGVYLARTRTSRVDGERGSLVIGGFPVERLASRVTFEQAVALLCTGEVPDEASLAPLRRDLARRFYLPTASLEALKRAAERKVAPMAALASAACSFDWGDDPEPESFLEPAELALLARMPLAVAVFENLRRGRTVPDGASDPALDGEGFHLAAAFLRVLDGKPPSAARVRALDTYLNTVVDHGANASTFTARVVVSTGAGLVPAVVGAIGALSGPLHGGAPGPALDLVREIGRGDRAEEVLRRKLEAGERLMGFGHRVYKVRDPRAAVLGDAAAALYDAKADDDPDRRLYELTREVEAVAVRLLDEHKPGRRLRANVELYTALLLHGLGLPTDLFTPVFAVGRTGGWIAHAREQRAEGRLIRPRLVYEGPTDRSDLP